MTDKTFHRNTALFFFSRSLLGQGPDFMIVTLKNVQDLNLVRDMSSFMMFYYRHAPFSLVETCENPAFSPLFAVVFLGPFRFGSKSGDPTGGVDGDRGAESNRS